MEIETVPAGAPDVGTNTEATKTENSTAGVAGQDVGGSTKQGNPDHQRQQDEAQRQIERHKLKFGKNEREVTLDELKMFAQKGWAADERFQEAARTRKEVEELIKKANWDKLIEKQTGKSAIEFYKERLKAEIRKAKMTDDERAVEEKKSELEKINQEIEAKKEAHLEEQRKAQQEHYEQKWDKELADAIDKEGLPKNRYALNRAIMIGKKLVDMDLEPDWTAVVRQAKSEMLDDYKALMAAFKDDNSLLGFVGDEFAQRLSKAMIAKKSAPPVTQKKAVESVKDNFRQKEAKPVDMDAWIENRRKKFENS